ncbi:MAG: hypothetical protein IV086_02380 [Hyphomonadaceae bacterium]|nr:MAG: hypothetical protein FD160_2911 [Caulobacteraceae bacterium]MBT9444529.1 hypothetical protein [Hyphomonadaceae bacterium]TPW07808.1 MAG: hypothetical protein FD124_838 [Alphaproteobacteria bacterium]
MHRLLATLACIALTACGPGDTKTVDALPEAETPTWTHAGDAVQVTLTIKETAGTDAFTLACAKAGPTLTFTAGIQQVGLANLAPPVALVLTSDSLPATLAPETADARIFSATAPLTPEALAALRDTTTARIFVNDGYAFAESAVDAGAEFETFASACAALTGVVAQ